MQSKRIMWAASALVLLAGCQKTPQSGQIVRFTAVSQPAVLTKVQYTGELDGGKERIDWKQGDAIRIYSSGAKASNDPSYTWADYAVTANGTKDGAKSKASISVSVSSPQGGLTWGSGTNTFYAIYPSPGGSADVATTVRGTSGTPFNCTIPTAQEGTAISVKDLSDQSADINVYYPNASAYHLAYNSLEEPATDTPLAFDPAYTAFHISAGHKDGDPNITIKSVTLKAASGNAVAGDFTAYYGGSAWTFGCPDYASGSNDAITFTFPGGNPVLSGTNKVEFVLYALPQNLTNLTLDFRVEISGAEKHRTLELKTAAAGTYYGHTYAAGESLIFNACKKAYIKGLLIPGATWTIDTGTTIQVKTTAVKDWTEVKPDINYGTDPVINASGLDELDHSAHLYEFFIYSPTGATWQVKVLNSSKALAEGVTITREERPDTSSDLPSGNGVLTGTVGGGKADAPGRVRFKLSLSSGSSGPYTLSFSVKISIGGTEYEYPINTEVIRGDGSGNGFENGNYDPINFS